MMPFFASTAPHIDIRPEAIFMIGPIAITNSMLLGVLGYGIVLGAFFYTIRKINRGEKNFFVKLVTWGYETLLRQVEGIIGDKTMARKVAPLPITLFFVIIVNYWIGILPFVGPITVDEVPVFRGLMADMNTTFALAIISMVAVQLYAFKKHGFIGNVKRYLVNPLKDPIGCFVGILEIIAELSRLVALSLRLFGNVFAGEVLLVMIGYMTQYFAGIALLPFMIFELFIGSIQAYVFFMLTTVFISLGMVSHGEHEDDHSPAPVKELKAVGNDA